MFAYNVVAAKGSTTTEVAQKQRRPGWPEALMEYTRKSFELVEDKDRAALETYIKQRVTQLEEENAVWTTDWSNEPLPVMCQVQSEDWRHDAQSVLPTDGTAAIGNSGKMVHSKRKKSRFDVVSGRNGQQVIDSEEQRAKRAKRFETLSLQASPAPVEIAAGAGFSEGVPDFDEYTIVGHATKLEKSYLRLTSAPDPGTVRPLHVLKDTLILLKKKWKEIPNYAYICDQFKSLRQDLTVQRIKNEFTIEVYELHARIALEKSDLGEYNQCQTQLQSLYIQMPDAGHPLEFLAYRILYMLHTRNLTEINTVLVRLTTKERSDPNIAHALAVRKAMACANYPRLFRLYMEAPNMSGYLMDNFVDRERIAALAIICKGYRPSLTLDQDCSRILAFGDVEELKDFLIGLDEHALTDSIKALPQHNSTANSTMNEPMIYTMDTKKAFDILENRKKAANRVDIKGQI